MNKAKWSMILLVICAGAVRAGSDVTSISSMDALQWEKVAAGVWKASIGKKELASIDYAGPPKLKALSDMGDAKFPFAQDAARGQVNASGTSVRLPLEGSEKIYGLGLEFKGINRRSNVYHLKVDHYGGVKGYTHAPVPFYVSSKGYGIFVSTARRPSFYVGIGNRKDSKLPPYIDRTTGGPKWSARPVSDAVEASVHGEGLVVYVFGGGNPLEAVRRYNLYCGGGVLPPRWGLGFWHRMHTRSSDSDVLKEVADFEKYDFPLDVIGLEPGWQSFAYPCSFEWDKTRFPEPKRFLKQLSQKGIRVNLWENPYLAPTSTISQAMKPYTGSHTVWLGEVPDYTLEAARKILLDHHQKNHLDIGVSGYKFDEVDGYDVWLWPDHAAFPSGHSAVQIRQLYGLMIQNMFMQRFREMNKRTYGLVRSSNGAASPSGFVIYSDYYDHRGYVTALVNCSLAGVLWTPEIRSARSDEEWLRRFQSVCFSPMVQLNAWSSGKKPWSFPKVTDLVRDVIKLRTRLLPYIYTAFYDYNQRGIPPFRAMVLETGFDHTEEIVAGKLHGEDNPYAETIRLETTDQYMMGPSILVAPVFAGQKRRKVVLPRGNWYDFYTGKIVGNGETITIETKLEQIPLFVKDGGIVPMMPSVNNIAGAKGTIDLEIRHYGRKENTYLLYDDDGQTFDYEKGIFAVTELIVKKSRGKLTGSSSTSDSKWQSRYQKKQG
ncbi:MAG: glycoside hydrolase family 31 protein [Planctomycetota bacterium]|jgi:alpha-D-xyloside xylohydrolase